MAFSILISGAAGFLGSHLSEALLKAGNSVSGIDNFDPFYPEKIKRQNLSICKDHPNFNLFEVDITRKEQLQNLTGNWDIVIHIAAKAGVLPSIREPEDYVNVNINGTLNMLEFIKARKIKKYIFASSSSIYGNNPEVPFHEDQNVDGPISPYAFSKRCGELMNFTYHKLYGIDCLNLRLFTLYGPRQRPDLSIHKFSRLISNNQPVEMYGNGLTARDYTHVSDVVKGFTLAIEYLKNNSNVYEIINIGNSNPIKLKELISTLFDAFKIAPNIIQLPAQAGDVEITYSDTRKAQKLLGYAPLTDFKEGLIDFVNWYKENLNTLQ